MINRVRSIIKESQRNQRESLGQAREAVWSQVYHDSIRGKPELRNLSLNVGRWAGNYSFFYVLNRILTDYKPKSILEFGLGESTKFISTFIENYLPMSSHTVIEHNTEWAEHFSTNFQLSPRSVIKFCPLEMTEVNGYLTRVYSGIGLAAPDKFDLYVIDGPLGSKRYSRTNLLDQVGSMTASDEFIVLLDDYNRVGEKDTAELVFGKLESLGIDYSKRIYSGSKEQLLIATNKYRYATSF